MTVDDLQDLYGELRGSRSAPAIMDARAHFLERQWQDALDSLNDAYQTYCESRQRILRQDPEKQVDAKAADRDRQVRRLKRKQDKAREIIETFETYLPQLAKLAEKERAKEEAKNQSVVVAEIDSPSESDPPIEAGATVTGDGTIVSKDAIDGAWLKQFALLIGDRQLEFVGSRFGFRALADPADVKPDAVYLLRKSERCFLLHAEPIADDPSRLNCVDICSAKNHVELSFQRMVRLSEKRKLVLLLEKGE